MNRTEKVNYLTALQSEVRNKKEDIRSCLKKSLLVKSDTVYKLFLLPETNEPLAKIINSFERLLEVKRNLTSFVDELRGERRSRPNQSPRGQRRRRRRSQESRSRSRSIGSNQSFSSARESRSHSRSIGSNRSRSRSIGSNRSLSSARSSSLSSVNSRSSYSGAEEGRQPILQQPQPLTSPRKLAKSLIKIIDIFTEKYTTTISRCKKKASQLTLAQKISDFLLDIRKIKAGTKISGAKLDFKLSKCQETLEKYKESVLLYQERVYKADDDSKNLMDSWEDSVDPVPSSKEELLHNTNIAQPIYCFFRDPECCSVEYDRTKLARLKGTSVFRRNTSPLTALKRGIVEMKSRLSGVMEEFEDCVEGPLLPPLTRSTNRLQLDKISDTASSIQNNSETVVSLIRKYKEIDINFVKEKTLEKITIMYFDLLERDVDSPLISEIEIFFSENKNEINVEKKQKTFSSSLKLQNVTLPIFSGKEKDYFVFVKDLHDILKAIVIPDEQKLIAIKNSCFPNIKDTVLQNASSVDEILSHLKQKYGNKAQHSARILSDLEKLPVVDDLYPQTTINFAEKVQSLYSLSKCADLEDTFISQHSRLKILQKLSVAKKMRLLEQFPTGKKSIEGMFDDLLCFLDDEKVKAYEIVGFQPRGDPEKRGDQVKGVSVKNTNMSNSKYQQPIKCMFCYKNNLHFPFSKDCPTTKGRCNIKQREMAERNGLCLRCLHPRCAGKSCSANDYLCKKGCMKDNIRLNFKVCDCGLARTLHSNLNPNVSVKTINACSNLKTTGTANVKDISAALMLTERVLLKNPVTGKTGWFNCFYDNGSNTTVVSPRAAKFGIVSGEIKNLQVTGFSDTFQNKWDSVNVVKMTFLGKDKDFKINAVEMKDLTLGEPTKVSVPPIWKDKFSKQTLFRSGKIDILIGASAGQILPFEVDRFVNDDGSSMHLFQSVLSKKFLLYGSDKQFVECLSKQRKPMCNRSFFHFPEGMGGGINDFVETAEKFEQIENKKVVDNNDDKPNNDLFVQVSRSRFEETDKLFKAQLTAEVLPNTDEREKDFATLQKRLEEKEMKNAIRWNGQTWTVDYLYNENLTKLQENKFKTMKRMESLNVKLMKDEETRKLVNEEIKSNIENGNWVKIDEANLQNGLQKHFVAINYVLQPSSTSTKLRIVADPSSTDQNGRSLNSCQKAGMSEIGSLKGCLMRFRTSQNVSLGDIAKFYNSFQLSERDQSLRRIFVPSEGFGESNSPTWTEYVLRKMSFGDKASPVLALLSKTVNTETNLHIVEPSLQNDVTRALDKQCYMDDVYVDSEWNGDTATLIKELEKLCKAGNMNFKKWINLGDDEIVKFLGYLWNAADDTIKIKSWFNVGSKLRGSFMEPALSEQDIAARINSNFTKKIALSLQGQLFDPLCIMAPMIIKLRMFYSKVCSSTKPDEWDSQLGDEFKKDFIRLFMEMLPVQKFEVARSIVPRGVNCKKPDCTLNIFCDGSLTGYAAAAYIRFEIGEEICSNLLTSTIKIAGTRKLTAPKSELLGGELAIKMALQVHQECGGNLNITEVRYFTDSRVLLSYLKMSPANLDLFTGSRTQYIKDNSDIEDWFWVPGSSNPADIATRDTARFEDVCSPFWLHGGFLQQPKPQWPAKKLTEEDLENSSTSDETINISKVLLAKITVEEVEEGEVWKPLLARFRNLDKVLNVLSKCLEWKFKADTIHYRRELAFSALLKDNYSCSKNLTENRKFHNGVIEDTGALVHIRQRNLEGLRDSKLIVVDPLSGLGKLLIRDAHDKYGHLASVRVVQSKLQEKGFYLPNSTPTITAEKRNCPLCKKLLAQAFPQQMGDVKKHRYQKSKPFSKIFVDLAGPFRAYDGIKKRTPGKIWALVIMCTYTRAIAIHCLENQSTDALVSGLNRHKSRYGAFFHVYSDLGTNLTAAGRLKKAELDEEDDTFGNQDTEEGEIEENLENQDNEEGEGDESLGNLTLEQVIKNVEWHHGVPKAPWGQGGVEAGVKMLKKQLSILKVSEGNRKMTALEYETLFCRIAAIINERPLIALSELGSTLCPNDLLYGHNNKPVDHDGPAESRLTIRHQEIQDTLKLWWKQYHADFNKSCKNLNKWKKAKKNIAVGDICLMLDSPNKIGSFRLAKVTKTFPDERGIVRRVEVQYSLASGQKHKVFRHTNILARIQSETEMDEENVEDVDDSEPEMQNAQQDEDGDVSEEDLEQEEEINDVSDGESQQEEISKDDSDEENGGDASEEPVTLQATEDTAKVAQVHKKIKIKNIGDAEVIRDVVKKTRGRPRKK